MSSGLLDQLELDLLNCRDEELDDDTAVEIDLRLNLSITQYQGLSNREEENGISAIEGEEEWKLLLNGMQQLIYGSSVESTNLISDNQLPSHNEGSTGQTMLEYLPFQTSQNELYKIYDESDELINIEVLSLMDSLIESIEYLFAIQKDVTLNSIPNHPVEDVNPCIEITPFHIIECDDDVAVSFGEKENDELVGGSSFSLAIPTVEEAKTYKIQLQCKDNQDEIVLKSEYENTKAWMVDEMNEIIMRKERRNEQMKQARLEKMAIRIQRIFRGWNNRRLLRLMFEEELAIRRKILVEQETKRGAIECEDMGREDIISKLYCIWNREVEIEQRLMMAEDLYSIQLRGFPLFRIVRPVDSGDPVSICCDGGVDKTRHDNFLLDENIPAVSVGFIHEPSLGNIKNIHCDISFDNHRKFSGFEIDASVANQENIFTPSPSVINRLDMNQILDPFSQLHSNMKEVEYFYPGDYSSRSSPDLLEEMNINSDMKSVRESDDSDVKLIPSPTWKFRHSDNYENPSTKVVSVSWTFQHFNDKLSDKLKDQSIRVLPLNVSSGIFSMPTTPEVVKSCLTSTKRKSLLKLLWQPLQFTVYFNRFSAVYRYLTNQKDEDIKALDLSVENLKDLNFVSSYRDINHLTLNVNKISSLLPLSSCANLEYLSAADNLLENCKGLEFLPNLRYLNMDSNRLVEMTYMDSHKLMILSLTCNQLSNIPNFRASNLLKLDLFGNLIECVDSVQLRRFPNLVHLNLGKNKIRSIANDAFEENKTLQTLILSHNQLKGLPKLMLPNLISLWCNGNHLISLDSWEQVVDQSHSGSSKLSGTAPFLFLPLLQKLFLQDNQIESIHATSLIGFPVLKEVDLSFNRLETVSSLDGLWVAKNLTSLKLNDNPIFKTMQESKFLSIKILKNFPKITQGSLIGGIEVDGSEMKVFHQVKAIYEARRSANAVFSRVESRGLRRGIPLNTRDMVRWDMISSSVDQKLKMQLEILQLEQELNTIRTKKLFLKRSASLDKCDQIYAEGRNHRFGFDMLRKISHSLSTNCSGGDFQFVSFQSIQYDQDVERIRDVKVPFTHVAPASFEFQSGIGNKKRPKVVLPVIDYNLHAITIQKIVRGFILRRRYQRVQNSFHYHDEELDELLALDAIDMTAFDLSPDELLLDDHYTKKPMVSNVLSSGDISEKSNVVENPHSTTFVYGDHKKRKFSARKNDEVLQGDGTDDLVTGSNESISRPGSSQSAVTIHSAKTSARSNLSEFDPTAYSDDSSKHTAKTTQSQLIEEWGISDPKLMATFLKRNKKIQNHIKSASTKEQNAEARYQKFVKQSQSSRAVPPHAPHGKPRPSARQIPPAWLSMDKPV